MADRRTGAVPDDGSAGRRAELARGVGHEAVRLGLVIGALGVVFGDLGTSPSPLVAPVTSAVRSAKAKVSVDTSIHSRQEEGDSTQASACVGGWARGRCTQRQRAR